MSMPPEQVGVALKEWAGVCEALLDGRQTILLRKGGIAEGPGGFSPEHVAFWLYPTRVHQAQQGLRPRERMTDQDEGHVPAPVRTSDCREGDIVTIEGLAVVEQTRHLDDFRRLNSLEPFHIWTEDTIRNRFNYRTPGLWVLTVRVYRRREPFDLAVTPEHLGCKSWVLLDAPLPSGTLEPVIPDREWAIRSDRLAGTIVAGPSG